MPTVVRASLVSNARRLVESFDREKYWWQKDVPCPFWGGESLPVHIHIKDWEPSPTDSQLKILEGLLTRSKDFRPQFESTFFEHYQKEIYGSVGHWSKKEGWHGMDELTPPISEPAEIWPRIGSPSVWISFVENDEWDGAIRFVLSFGCPWDEEHGLSIEITDWEITSYHAD